MKIISSDASYDDFRTDCLFRIGNLPIIMSRYFIVMMIMIACDVFFLCLVSSFIYDCFAVQVSSPKDAVLQTQHPA